MQLNTDRVVSLSAMLVGLGSLFIIVYQTALLREQQAASGRLFDLGDAPQSWYDGANAPKSGPDKAIIEITYRSVYGDRWRVMSDTVVPQAL